MTAYATASHASYRESAILTAPPEQLVIMLYDGVHRFLLQAISAMREGRAAEAGERLGRATAIIDELQGTLDLSVGVIAERLSGIYVFCRRHLADGLAARTPVQFLVFDLLWLDGVSTVDLPYAERRDLLDGLGRDSLGPAGANWQTPPYFGPGGGAAASRLARLAPCVATNAPSPAGRQAGTPVSIGS